MILDPGIANFQPKGDYPPYDDGIAQGKLKSLGVRVFVAFAIPIDSAHLPLYPLHTHLSDVFIKDHEGKPIVGKVWPGNTVFPDFSSLNANLWWAKNLAELHILIPSVHSFLQ